MVEFDTLFTIDVSVSSISLLWRPLSLILLTNFNLYNLDGNIILFPLIGKIDRIFNRILEPGMNLFSRMSFIVKFVRTRVSYKYLS